MKGLFSRAGLWVSAFFFFSHLHAQESVDLQFINQLQNNNTTLNLSGVNWPGYAGTQMEFTNVASLPNGQSIDLRATVESPTGPFAYDAIAANFNQGDLGFLYRSTNYGTGGVVLRLTFFAGGGTFTLPFVMPRLRLTFYDVDGESVAKGHNADQSECVRVFRADGFSGYELPSGDLSVTLTEENGGDSFLFTGPGINRDETDRRGAFMVDFTNTASIRLGMHSSTTSGSPNNPMFAAIDGDLSQIDSTGLAPEITQEPADLTLPEGTSGSFAVVATGAAPLRYQWKKGDVAISGATNSTYSISAAQLTDEGFYSVTVANNYGAVFSRSARLNVIQQIIPPEQIAFSGLQGVYNGLPHVVSASSPDLVAADFRIEYESSSYAKTTNAPVLAGSYQVTATVVKPGFGGSKTGTLEVAPAQLTITADSFVRFYGETNPVLTYRFNGWVNQESEAIITSPVLISTLADANSMAGVYEVVVSGAVAPNYAITFVPGQITVLGGLANTLSFPAVSAKTYGDASFSLQANASSGLPVSYTSSNPQVAEVSGSLVTIRGAGEVTLTARQPGNANYLAAEDVSISLFVRPKDVTVSGISAVDRPYNGALEVDLLFGTITLTGVIDGDQVSAATSGVSGRLAHPSPGTGKAVELIGLQLAGEDAGNYVLLSPGITVDISPRPLLVLAENKARRYGEENPELTYSVPSPGLAQGDVIEVAGLSTSATSSSVPGAYPITFGGIIVRSVGGQDVTSRYILDPRPGTLTVQKGIQTISFAVLPDKTYGDAPFPLTATASSGLPVIFSSENPACLEISGSNAILKGAGSYTVTARQTGSELWEAADPVGRIQTIHPKGVVVAARSTEVYVNQIPTLEFDVLTPLAPGDTTAGVFTNHPSDPAQSFGPDWLVATGWNSTLTGSFPIVRSHANSPVNYAITEFRPGLLTVLPGPGVAAGTVSPLAGGQNHSLLLRASNGVATWGLLGAGLDGVPTNRTVAGVAAGSSAATYSLAWTTNGEVLAWGSNSLVVHPAVMASLTGVVGLAGGDNHALALRADGTVQAWGDNSQGQTTVPVELAATNHADFRPVVAVSAAANFSIALRADGTVRKWGGTTQISESSLASLTNAVGIAAGSTFALTLMADGSVRYHGPSGNLDLDVLPAEVTSPALLSANPVVAVAAGSSHALALRRDGSVVAWGYNNQQQISLPAGLANVAAVAAGNAHSLLLLRSGEIRVATSNTNSLVPAGLSGALPRGGPDSDGDGWSNEAELRAGAHPLQTANRPRKVAFLDGSLTANVQEGPAFRPVGELRVLDVMGWREDALLSGISLSGPDANKFRLINGQLQTAVALDYDGVSSQRTLRVFLAHEGLAEEFVINLTDDPSDTDSDGDGLTDVEETSLGTNPNAADTDNDGLSDGVETGTGAYVSGTNTGTNPLLGDTDGDGWNDGAEIALGISPFDLGAYPDKPVIPPELSVAGNGEITFSFSRILPMGSRYQLQSSPNLSAWTNVGAPVQGTGGEVAFTGVSTNSKLFYRVIALP